VLYTPPPDMHTDPPRHPRSFWTLPCDRVSVGSPLCHAHSASADHLHVPVANHVIQGGGSPEHILTHAPCKLQRATVFGIFFWIRFERKEEQDGECRAVPVGASWGAAGAELWRAAPGGADADRGAPLVTTSQTSPPSQTLTPRSRPRVTHSKVSTVTRVSVPPSASAPCRRPPARPSPGVEGAGARGVRVA